MSDTSNIVVVGCSFGGMSAAHYICRHMLPQLQRSSQKYVLHMIDPSTHFWWHNGSPRAMVSVNEMKHNDSFVPIMEGFKQYKNLQDSIVFTQGTAMSVDPETRTISIKKVEGGHETLSYHALVIGTGILTPTPLTTLHGDHIKSQRALDDMNAKLKIAKSVVVGGGGPLGVEIAGEIATHYPGTKVTLVTRSDKLFHVLRKSLGEKAQKQLEKAGVKVLYGVEVTGPEETSDGKTNVKLGNGESIQADVYIPAVGVTPNTAFLPETWKNGRGYVKTNPQTLRVDDAGARVYAVGDVAGVNAGGVLNLFDTIPIWGANMSHDLLADAKAGNVAEKQYHDKKAETQLVPIGAKTGVGAFNGWSMPAMAVSMLKGKDYMLSQMPPLTTGSKWAKA
ncbi:hypothetical protein LTR09_007296 [Extremus antarcticus]|uniref:FAD/NAD(P)-binding domain-containing protein n=1 Tax=Extremus antarcticus TaxID=702011 RepID=A0AAJ0DJQ1_9PEZI|nr:hypothetical protein LTR09_007296 [Extremus antarcticus]